MIRERAAQDGWLFLVSNGSGDASPARSASEVSGMPAPQEVLIDGRRYRLVPVDGVDEGTTKPADAETPGLTAREVQIARLVASGMVNKQIAAELRISEWTVATHLRRIFAKLGVETRAAMVSRCFGEGRR